MTLFLDRDMEQERFRELLAKLPSGRQPDEGFVVLVHGMGGMGKSALLQRFREIAAGGVETAGPRHQQEFLVVAIDWQDLQRRYAEDYAVEGGPPIWVVLDQVYGAVHGAAASDKRDTAAIEKVFGPFREQMLQLPQLAGEVAQAFPARKGERVTTASDVQALIEDAGRGFAAMAGVHPVGALAGLAAESAVDTARALHDVSKQIREWRRGAVPDNQYRQVLRRLEALVDAFGQAMRGVSRRARPVLLVLDTCELISGSQEWLRRAMRASGSRAAWVISMRLEPEVISEIEGEEALYRREIPESRMLPIPLSRFSDDIINEFLDRVYRDRHRERPAEVTVAKVAEITHGVPLAVSLVCKLLDEGLDPEVALVPVAEPGRPSTVIRVLAERYLAYAMRYTRLQADLPLLYGLALLYGDRLDADLLAALWDIDPTDVAGHFADLATRHDFVLRDSRSLHNDVRDTIRFYLLDDALRTEQVPMNQRAVAHLRRRLVGLGLTTVDDQITSDEWRGLTIALLWHTFWADNRSGIAMLCHLLPAAEVLSGPLAAALLQVATFFVATLNTQQKGTIRALETAYQSVVFSGIRLPEWAKFTPRTDDGGREALAVLDNHNDGDISVLAASIPRTTYMDLLSAMLTRDPAQAVTALEHASQTLADFSGMPGPTSRALAQLAEQLATRLIFGEGVIARSSQEGLRAAEVATRHGPESADAWWLLGIANFGLDRTRDGTLALIEAERLDPLILMRQSWTDPDHVAKVLRAIPEYQSGEELRDQARRLADKILAETRAEELRGHALELIQQGRQGDAADNLRQAIELQPDEALEARVMLAALIWHGNPNEAVELASDALDVAGEAFLSRFRQMEMRALAFLLTGDPHAAASELRSAAELHWIGEPFQSPLYKLLDDPAVPGLDDLLAIWTMIGPGASR